MFWKRMGSSRCCLLPGTALCQVNAYGSSLGNLYSPCPCICNTPWSKVLSRGIMCLKYLLMHHCCHQQRYIHYNRLIFFCLSFYLILIAEQLDTATLLGRLAILFLSQRWCWGTIMAFMLGFFASVKAVLQNKGLFWQGKSCPNHWSSNKACGIKPSGSSLTEHLQFFRSPVHNGLLFCG